MILKRRTRVRSMNLCLTELSRGSIQLDLFADPKPDRRLKLEFALDALRQQYGKSVVTAGQRNAELRITIDELTNSMSQCRCSFQFVIRHSSFVIRNLNMFTHLHVHSNYSFCRGASKIEALVDAALARGMSAMALTDINGVYGLVWFLQYAAERGLRPIVGSELRTEKSGRFFWRATAMGMRLFAASSPGASAKRISV